ncbi:hypothetical protein ACYULU_12780 [Breznakiellaceae bacterium SP9]
MQEAIMDTAVIGAYVQSYFHGAAVRVQETTEGIMLTPVEEAVEAEYDSYELGKDVFGKYGSGRSDLSVNYKTLLKDMIRAKHRSD